MAQNSVRGRKREACTFQLLAPWPKGGPLQVFNSPALLGCTRVREALGQEARGSGLRCDHVGLSLCKGGGSPRGSGCRGSGYSEVRLIDYDMGSYVAIHPSPLFPKHKGGASTQ